MKNIICMHEVDDGILWKHTNYRNDKARCIRNRKLVVQTIATVGNYEYMYGSSLMQSVTDVLASRGNLTWLPTFI